MLEVFVDSSRLSSFVLLKHGRESTLSLGRLSMEDLGESSITAMIFLFEGCRGHCESESEREGVES